jgi:integrase
MWHEMQKVEHDAARKDCPLVFHYLGRPIGSHIKGWDKACNAVGPPGLHFHDLRRSAVRNLERAGVPRQVAMKITGTRPNQSISGMTSYVRAT